VDIIQPFPSSSRGTMNTSPLEVMDTIRKRQKIDGKTSQETSDSSPSKMVFKGEVVVRDLQPQQGKTILDTARAIQSGEAVSNWSYHKFRLVSVNPQKISERICIECPQKLNMVQSTSTSAVCFDGHKNRQVREVICLHAAVLDAECTNQTVYEVRIHHNATLDIWPGLTLKMLLELDNSDRQAFFEVYSGTLIEGRCFFYLDKFRSAIGSITVREAKILPDQTALGAMSGNGATNREKDKYSTPERLGHDLLGNAVSPVTPSSLSLTSGSTDGTPTTPGVSETLDLTTPN